MPAKKSQTENDCGFDAVAVSRRWKEAVAAETAGLSISERMAWFRRQSSVPTICEQALSASEDLVSHEEPPEYGPQKP